MNSLFQRSVLWVVFALSLLLGLWLRASYDPEWLQRDDHGVLRAWTVEADCYERLTEVQHILKGDGLIQRFHPYENWPQGLIPSTTAPLDYCILALYFPLKLITAYPLDWAGALVSPLLWVGLLIFWAVAPLTQFNWKSRMALMLGSALSFGFFWGTAFGRPDHQSLILVLFAIAFTAEFERWDTRGIVALRWHQISGLCWGIAMWTSLFEPALIFVLLILFNLVVRRKENLSMLLACGIVMLIALLLEGVHVFIPHGPEIIALQNWGSSISELLGLSPVDWFIQHTFILLPLPFLVWRTLSKDGARLADIFFALLTVLLLIAAGLERRWIYFSTLGELILVARYFALSTSRWVARGIAAYAILALFYSIIGMIVDGKWNLTNQPSPEMETLAQAIDGPGGVLAPWWLASGIGYDSGQPIVACSSHASVSGLIDSAEFYTSESWSKADRLVRKRHVRWIVVVDDDRYDYPLLNKYLDILGHPILQHQQGGAENPEAQFMTGQRLITGRYIPTEYQLRNVVAVPIYFYQNHQVVRGQFLLKLYEFVGGS